MKLFRIADRRFNPESGEGARLHGARWNSPCRPVLYTSTSYAVAMLEKWVHTGRQIPKNQVCITFEVPDSVPTLTLDAAQHPGWEPADGEVSRAAGDSWLAAAQSAVLLVPSVVFDVEQNALINPEHPDSPRIRILSTRPVRWGDRLFAPLPR